MTHRVTWFAPQRPVEGGTVNIRRPAAGTFAGPLARVRFASAPCGRGQHGACAGGVNRRRGDLPCSCDCHITALTTALAYCSTMCHLADNPDHPDAEHAKCPGPRGELWAEVPGRRDHVRVPCTCGCHEEET